MGPWSKCSARRPGSEVVVSVLFLIECRRDVGARRGGWWMKVELGSAPD
jgi:hypothetical protein